MLEQALIDGLKFAREGRHLQGQLPLSQLSEVTERLLDSAGNVSYALRGFVDRRGKPGIEVQTQARLALVCQRCLNRLDFDLRRHTRFMLIADGVVLPGLEDEETETEAVPAETVANVRELVEQEVLLGLPLAPTHPDGACAAPEQAQRTERASPFAVLGQLKDSKHAD